ncbi:hypothetical protein EVA_07612 [gut metagenome]|uniref:Uncharacterized protein n=1 Tax=gut metagenome TaxID=749906 RepID=J9GBP7_9ZZZZ
MHPFCSGDICQHRVFGNEVSDHDKSSPAYIQRSEKGFFHPVSDVMHPLFIATQFVIVQIVYDDVVRACFAVAQTTRRLSPSTSEEFHSVGRLELPFLPGGISLLLAKIGNDALVMLQFGLNIP